MDQDFVWLKMLAEDMIVGIRPSQVACMIAREQKSMIIGEEVTRRVDIYLVGPEEDKPIRVAGTAAEVAEQLGLPQPGVELEAYVIGAAVS